jgi:integrase
MEVRLRDRSGIRLYRYVVEDADRHGNIRLYFKRRGNAKKTRLLETPGTTAFDEEYKRAFLGEPKYPIQPLRGVSVLPGSLRWLCQLYYGSAAFQSLVATTRNVRRAILDGICERLIEGKLAGDLPFAEMEPRHVAKLRDEKAALPEAANARVKALRQLFKWACSDEYRYATKNPARDVEYLRSNNPDGFRAWSEKDVAKYEARHPIGTKARLALDLLLYTGVRRSDVVTLGPQMERWFSERLPDSSTINVQKLVFTETKGRKQVAKTHELPILAPLRRSIDATQTGHLVYLVTQFGKPHSVKAFGNWFKRRCREAGLDDDLSAHGLRKLGAQRCAEAGATEHQLMALFGWTTAKQAALYTKRANRAKLEAAATPLLLGQNGNESQLDAAEQPLLYRQISNKRVPLFPAVSSGGTITAKKP